MKESYAEIEQPPGYPLVEPISPRDVDKQRKRLYFEYERFLTERIHKLDHNRPSMWDRDYSSEAAYEESVAQMRDHLKTLVGFWIEPKDRDPIVVLGSEVLVKEPDFDAIRTWIRVEPELETYMVELVPKAAGPHPGLVVQHGYAGTPEAACGLTKTANALDYSYRSLGIRAVKRGYRVAAPHHPSGYGSSDDAISTPLPTHPQFNMHYGKNRLHRLAVLAGGTLLGLDLLATSRAFDHLAAQENVDEQRIGIYGLSRGGWCALWLPAIDTRFKASVSSAHFNTRLRKLLGPQRGIAFVEWETETVFFRGFPELFSDSDIGSLIIPRAFAVEAGVLDGSVDFETVGPEYDRLREHFDKMNLADRTEFIVHSEGHVPVTRQAFDFLDRHLQRRNA